MINMNPHYSTKRDEYSDIINALKVEVDFKIYIHDGETGEKYEAKYVINGEVDDLLPWSASP